MAEVLENVLRELGLSMLIRRFTEANLDTVEVAKLLTNHHGNISVQK